jgi:hypothetical protein
MNEFAVISPAERQAAFTETVARTGLNPLIVKKTTSGFAGGLGRRFEMPNLPGPHLQRQNLALEGI